MTQRRVSRRDLIKYGGATVGHAEPRLDPRRLRRDEPRRATAETAATADGRLRRRRPANRDQLRELAALHRQGQGRRTASRSTRRSYEFKERDGHHGQLQRRDPGQRLVLRQAAAAAAGRPGHRARHHRHHERARADRAASLNGWVTELDPSHAAELRRERRDLGQGPRLRPREQVLDGLAVGPHRARLEHREGQPAASRSSTT